jgi:ADP-ribosyl-[dinitrogen reductase] hydrolase
MTRLMLDNRNLPAAAETARQMLSAWEGCNETEIKIDAALAEGGGANRRAAVASLGEGWIGEEALAIGLYSPTVGGSFPEVLSIAANHDGDSDSTASIAGQLYGISKGLSDMPNQWVRRLDVLSILLGLVRETFG